MNRRAIVRSGAALLAVYAIAAVATMRLSPLHVRPLYESIGTPPPYKWVNPPTQLAKGNSKPKAETRPVGWTSDGNTPDSPTTSDAQAIVSFSGKAIAPKAGVDGADVSFTPLDALKLGVLPDKELRPDGNAYRIDITYSPTDEKITQFAKTPIVVLRWATNGLALYYSPDGKDWRKLTSGFNVTPAPSALVSADWAGNGYYLAVSHGPLSDFGQSNGSHNYIGTIITAVLVLIPIGGIVWFVFPRKQPAQPGKKTAARKKKNVKRR